MATTKQKRLWLRRLLGTAAALCLLAATVSVCRLVQIGSDYREAQSLYTQLRAQYAPSAAGILPTGQTHEGPEALNPDYVGWLSIPGSDIDYPLVLGADNETYLHTTFTGTKSDAGALFLDYRNAADFSSLHTMIFGHNRKDGSMFGTLSHYLDPAYLAEHAQLSIVTKSGETLRYRIVVAYETDAYDAIYNDDLFAPSAPLSDFWRLVSDRGVPLGSAGVLTLSTCGASSEQRVVVHAVPHGAA